MVDTQVNCEPEDQMTVNFLFRRFEVLFRVHNLCQYNHFHNEV